MNPSKRIISKSEIYKGVGKIPDPAPLDPRFESCWELPGSIGAGSVLAMELRQGLDLLVFDCSLRESLVSSAEDLPISRLDQALIHGKPGPGIDRLQA